MGIVKLTDESTIQVTKDFSIINGVYQFNTTVDDFAALEDFIENLNDNNLVKVVYTDDYGSANTYMNLTLAEPMVYVVKKGVGLDILFRLREKSKEDLSMEIVDEVIQDFDDEKALTVKVLYNKWETYIGKTIPTGTKLVYYNRLYKVCTVGDLLVLKNQAPGPGTESLYTCIDETHEGTYEDPIPYYGNMVLEQGKYYSQDGVTYVCTQGTGNAVFADLVTLKTFVAQYKPASGTLYDPIEYYGGIALEEGKYYKQDGQIYECWNSSGIPVYNDLKDLATFVKPYVPEPIHAGTYDDPIPYVKGETLLTEDVFYSENELIYQCIQGSNVPLDDNLANLSEYVKLYNREESGGTEDGETTEPEQPKPGEDGGEDPDGSLENPIPYVPPMKLYNGTYYSQDGVVYECFRDTGNPVSHNLADLVLHYVNVVE